MTDLTATPWWQPGKPDEMVPGVLVEDEEHGWVLNLDGSFEEPDWSELAKAGQPVSLFRTSPRDFPIVLGKNSDGGLASLIDCQVLKWSPSIPSMSRGFLKLWPTILVNGVHVESAEGFRLRSLSIRYTHLDTWTATHGFAVKFGTALYPVEIRYAKPEPVECALPGGLTVGIGFSASGPAMPVTADLRITQQSWLTVASETDLPFKTLLEHVTNFADLVALGVGEPLRPLELSATCNAQDPSGASRLTRISLVYNQKPLVAASRDVPRSEMLFTLPDIRDRFSDLVTAWFGRDIAFRSLCALYFGTVRSPFMYVEHRFLNMFQALESFHRRTSQLSAERMQRHEERLNSILGAVSDKKDRKWLKQALRHSHEPAAADRIKQIVEKLDAGWLLSPDDIEHSARLRNYYTHFDPKIEENLSPTEERILAMHNLEVRLRVLCELVLLNAVGFPMDKVVELVKGTHRLERRLVSVGA